jgi:hypothetical protein
LKTALQIELSLKTVISQAMKAVISFTKKAALFQFSAHDALAD